VFSKDFLKDLLLRDIAKREFDLDTIMTFRKSHDRILCTNTSYSSPMDAPKKVMTRDPGFH
jgi:hypothetical protein